MLKGGAGPFGLEDRRLLFVGGKGGVGKTTVASALGLGAAERGEKVLVVSTDPAHSLGDAFGTSIGGRPTRILEELYGLEVDPDQEVDRYLSRVEGTMRRFVRPEMYREIQRQIDLTRSSPGAVEAALMDRVAELMDEGGKGYDRVVFDTAPTGHTLRLLALPEIMAAWTDGLLKGRDRSDSFARALDRLGRPSAGADPVPVEGGGSGSGGRAGQRGEKGASGESAGGKPRSSEGRGAGRGDDLAWFDDPEKEEPEDERTREIRDILTERRRKFTRARRLLLDRDTTAFLLVLIPEKLPILESRKAAAALRKHKVPLAGVVVNRVLPPGPLGDFLESRRAQESAYLDEIERDFGRLPRIRVPLLPTDVEGVDALRKILEHLTPS